MTACGGGGGVSIAGAGPQPITTATSGAATPSAPGTSAPTPAATTTPQLRVSPTPTVTPGGTSTAAPTPTAAASTAATCTNPNMGSQNETWTLNGSSLTIPLPPYGTFAGTIDFPTQTPASTVVSETTNQTNFNFAPTSSSGDPGYGSRTDDFFMSFRLSQATTFSTAFVPVTIASTCLTSGTTYYLDQFTNSDFVYVNSAVASAGEITLNVLMSPNPYPAGVYINAVLNH